MRQGKKRRAGLTVERSIAVAFGLLVAVLALLSARRLTAAWFARQDSIEGVAGALSLTPSDAGLHQRYAALWKASERQDLVRGHLELALQLNPRLTSVRLALAQRAGMLDRDPRAAVDYLLAAAAFDRQFDPRWALANLHLRQGNQRQFEYWLEQSAAMAYDGGRPLFALAMRTGLPPEFARDRLARGRPAFERSLLAYASESQDARWALLAAPRVLVSATAEDRELLLGYSEFLLAQGLIDEAVEVWNRLTTLGILPHGRLGAEGNLVNSDFRLPLTSRSFDWHRLPAPGVAFTAGRGLSLDFSTADVESCDLLSQVVPVTPGTSRVLEAVSVAVDRELVRGLNLWVSGWPDRRPIAMLQLRPGAALHGDTVRFAVPRGVRAVRILLSYARPAGAVGFRGEVKLASIRLD